MTRNDDTTAYYTAINVASPAETRARLDAAARTPALDVTDLLTAFRTDKDRAWAMLAGLSREQLVLQAEVVASAINDARGLVYGDADALTGAAILERWETVLTQRTERAVAGVLEQKAEEHAAYAWTARVEGEKADAAFFQRAVTAYTNALIEWQRGVRPISLGQNKWLLPSRRPGEAPHIVRMDGDWMCTCKAGSQMHWPIALIIGLETVVDDLADAARPMPDYTAAQFGARLAQARAVVLAAAA